jgi:rhomboid protease GluP
VFQRKRTGSVLCPSCGQLVGVNDDRCLNCGRLRPGMWGLTSLLRRLGPDLGFVPIVTWACGVLYLCTLAVDLRGVRTAGLAFLEPSGAALFLFGASGAIPVYEVGRWWTVLSAGWLHGGVLHILFNLMWVRDLAPAVTHLYGGARTVLIYTAATVVGFLASSTAGFLLAGLPRPFAGAPLTIGASAAIFGLLGALVHFGRRGGSSRIGDRAKAFAVILAIFGFVFPGVDNWAHLGGFGGGYLTARFLDPLRPERADHVIAALACLLLSAASVVASVITGLPYFR